MAETTEASIDDIIKSIREAIVNKERHQYFNSFYSADTKVLQPEGDVFELSRHMLVKREDIPYKFGIWTFDDVAKKMLKKYKNYFNFQPQNASAGVRVRVKKNA